MISMHKSGLISRLEQITNFLQSVTLTELISKRKVNNFIYTSLLKSFPPPIRSQEKWPRDLRGQNECDVNWKVSYTIAFNCTLSTKLRTFHFKLLHRRIATNDFPKKISLVQSDKFCFCEHETETVGMMLSNSSFKRTLEMILFSQIFI